MTAKARAGMARVLGLELALLTAEVELLEELIAKGILPEGARRTPTAPELRAGVRFAELDRIVNESAALLARKADRVRDRVLDGLAEQLAATLAEADPWAALEELARLTDPTDPAAITGLADTIAGVEAELADDLVATARAGHAEALEEARRQGLPDRLLPDVDDPATDAIRAAARAQAKTVAQAPAARLLDVAAKAGSTAATQAGATGATVVEAALDAAEQASRAGTEDAARQAANVTHGLGRAEAQRAMPAPSEVYASELLDSNTCGPCATVDGRTYESLEAGLVDYPGAGGYADCDGGSRCRGTLVLVHGTEAPPTLDNPGQGPASPGGPADRTPQGPSVTPTPEAPTLPTAAPDAGVPEQLAQPADNYPDLDADGRTVMPVEDLEEPITTVAPDDVDRDPELARLSEAELDEIMADPWASDARKLAAADEFDQRAAGARTQVFDEEQLDAATLARYEEEREAWERAGGQAADAFLQSSTQQAGGRRIDHVRAAWAEEVEQMHIRADLETNGYLIAKDKLAEFQAKYANTTAVMFEGPARVAYYYASRELRDHWAQVGRPTFSEFALERGVTDAKTRARAAAARRARDDAALRADESAAGRAKRERQRAEKRKRRGPLSAGERLAQEQRRRDRIKARERKLAAEQRANGALDTPAPAPREGVEWYDAEYPAELRDPELLARSQANVPSLTMRREDLEGLDEATIDEIMADVPQGEERALAGWRAYTGGRYRDMNRTLRDGEQLDADAYIDAFDEFFASRFAVTVAEPTTAYRGLRTFDTFDPADVRVGQLMPDPGYASATASEAMARGFGDWVLNITMTPGSRYVPGTDYERELVLPRGSIVRIVARDEATKTLTGEIVLP